MSRVHVPLVSGLTGLALVLGAVGTATAAGEPPNDDFATATPLAGPSGTAPLDTTNATNEAGEPGHSGCFPDRAAVWYSWTAQADGYQTFESLGDHRILAAYTGSAVDSLVRVGSDEATIPPDTGVGDSDATASFAASAGTTYHIAVAGSSPSELTWHPGRAGVRPSSDLDGDGLDDVVAGVPGEDVGTRRDAGAVQIRYSTGTTAYLTQDSTGIPGGAEGADRFGAAVATGDLDGDGADDLVVGVPGEDLPGAADTGTVIVVYGGPDGLDTARARQISQDVDGAHPGGVETGDQFGAALATGELGHSTGSPPRLELVVGAPGEDVSGKQNAGAYFRLASDATVASRSTLAFFPGGGERAGDRFGAALAVGRFDIAGEGVVAAGAPGHDVAGAGNAGMVAVELFGFEPGSVDQGGFRSDASPEPGDAFGSALTAADTDNDGLDELWISAPKEDVAGRSDAGSVTAADSCGLFNTVTQNSRGVWGSSERGDRFGSALDSADLDGDLFDHVLAGTPREGLTGKPRAGAILVLEADGSSARTITQATSGVAGAPEAYDWFGAEVRSTDLDGDDLSDLLLAAPKENAAGRADVGVVSVLRDDAAGFAFWQGAAGTTGSPPEAFDTLGAALAP
ncbi:MAG: FG-GAP-like repeat-containing protein [Streptomycetales bacterium]